MPAAIYTVRRARSTEAAAAVTVLREAAAWSSNAGRPTWSASDFSVDAYIALAAAGELVVGCSLDEIVACMLLQRSDPTYWPMDPPGEALYLHKIAIRRSVAGTGWVPRFLEWASNEARHAGAIYLRLNTLDRPKLVGIYEKFGFRVVDAYARHSSGESIVRLEMRLRRD